MSNRILVAKENMIFTNGEIYGRKIYLAEDQVDSDWYEITEEEYNTILDASNLESDDV